MTAVALWGWLRPAPVTSPRPVRFVVSATQGVQFGGELAFSPDGSRFVYRGFGRDGQPRLYVRDIDEIDVRPIPGTEGARQPFFSPDGQWLGYHLEPSGRLRKVSVTGGPSLPLGPSVPYADTRGASWGPDDVIVFSPDLGRNGLMRVSAAGGVPEVLTVPDTAQGETRHRFPEILPGGHAVVFTILSGDVSTARLAVASLESGRVTHLLELGTDPHYVDTGHLIYARSDGSVMAVPFDLGTLAVTGQAIPLLDDLAELALSRNGSLAYIAGGGASGGTLVLVDRQGAETPVNAEVRSFRDPKFSPGGDRLAVVVEGDIWVYDMDQGTLSVRTFDGFNRYPTWTPDGKRIAFSSSRAGLQSLFTVPADGSGSPESLLQREKVLWQSEWSPDRKWLAFREGNVDPGNGDILAVPVEGEDQAPRPIAQTPFNERMFAISPDGRWIAYTSDQSGRNEVYVRGCPDPVGQVQVSVEGGIGAAWSPDGRELFYRTANGMMAAVIETGPSFKVRKRELLFEDDYARNPGGAQYDIDPRSGQFLLIKRAVGDVSIVVVVNWFEEVRRLTGEAN